MSNPKWEIGPVKLIDGREAIIDAINGDQEDFRYSGRVRGQRGIMVSTGWHANGRYMYGDSGHPHNLAPPPKKTVRVQRWLNIYLEGEEVLCGVPNKRRKDCDTAARTLFACIEIDREVEEGEGL